MVRGLIVVEVGGDPPDRTLEDFIARAKASKLSYASPGIGSAPHFAGAVKAGTRRAVGERHEKLILGRELIAAAVTA